jgi:hypothetical protein
MYNRRLFRLDLFQPENVNNVFLRNVGTDLPDYAVVREHEASQFGNLKLYTECPRRKGQYILGGHINGHSKQKSVYVHVSYSERFPR